ncbi:MAG: hypothetical protein GEU73_13905 [Chloroflexi bacterium]|nr:hypothetical protein [Chloroflexota bacterium]
MLARAQVRVDPSTEGVRRAKASSTSSTDHGPPTLWPVDLARLDFVVVDLETTGLSPAHDRVIEIAAVRVRDGQVRGRWRSLVDPGMAVPSYVTALTGISTGMLARAPVFRELVDPFRRFLGGAILVAHQVSFDNGFLHHEFVRLGEVGFAPDLLCTIKLARRLFPGLPAYTLESLIQRFGLTLGRQHRALPDAMATADLLNMLVCRAVSDGAESWHDLRRLADGPRAQLTTADRRRLRYEPARLRELPVSAGVYLLKDADENVFYIGKSVNVRRRVADHLRGGAEGQPRLRRHLRYLADVQVIPAASELEALILEARLIRRYLPVANQQLREQTHYPFIRIDVQSSFPRIQLTRSVAPDNSVYFGPFRSARVVGHVVDYVRTAFGIRECTRERLPDGRSCLLLDLKKCLGPCVGVVSEEEYRAAVERAVTALRGDWTEIIDGLDARMVELADREQFEEAAAVRDTLRHLRSFAGALHRLAELQTLHAVLIERIDGLVRLSVVRAGRLVHEAVLTWPDGRRHLSGLCRRFFAGAQPDPITSDAADEAHIVSAWVRQRQHHPDCSVLDIDLENLPSSIARIRAELDRLCVDSSAAGTAGPDEPEAKKSVRVRRASGRALVTRPPADHRSEVVAVR